jgi:hypothetical protein
MEYFKSSQSLFRTRTTIRRTDVCTIYLFGWLRKLLDEIEFCRAERRLILKEAAMIFHDRDRDAEKSFEAN